MSCPAPGQRPCGVPVSGLVPRAAWETRAGTLGPQHDGQGSPPAPAPWSANAARGWNPKVFFQVGAAFSFPECASTIVASRSTGIRFPSAPGARSPASAQARSRAAARALRIAPQRPRRVRGQRADQPGDHRVRGHRPGQLRLGPQHRDIGQAVPAQRQRHGQVGQDFPRVVHRPRRPPPGQARRTGPRPGLSPAPLRPAAAPRPGTPAPGRRQTR